MDMYDPNIEVEADTNRDADFDHVMERPKHDQAVKMSVNPS
jgi:hypothetical protein